MISRYPGIGLAFIALTSFSPSFSQVRQHPNVLIILTDDQGFGDLGINGNPHVKTPVIDHFAKENIRFNNFYASPVCAPTRSSLMTGRYSLRTGIRDTYNGGAIMATGEVTIAEMLKQADYKTGIFGKWHLGDNYPSRPNDQGFDESVVHLSGGMGQVGDITTYFRGDSSYFDPVLWHNGKKEAYKGYCSDIFASRAIDFITRNHDSPFFCYLAFNAPHTPLQVPESYFRRFRKIDPSAGFGIDKNTTVQMSENEKEDARKIYAMLANIDDNIGKVLHKLDELNLTNNTVVIFMSDNGPQQKRYNAELRGLKGSVYRGGVRVPFYLRYPALFKGNKDIEISAAHIDILPTLANLCHVEIPKGETIDGKTLLPVINGEHVDWENRSLFFYWTRRYPELYNNMALQKGKYKLVGHTDYNSNIKEFELFDLATDPSEQNNLVNSNVNVAIQLKAELMHLTGELLNSPNLIHPPRIIIGSEHENPVFLNRNDADGEPGIWDQKESYGFWRVTILEGNYNIRFKFIEPVEPGGQMSIETKTFITQMKNKNQDGDIIEMKNVHLTNMDCDFVPYYLVGSKRLFPFWVEIEKI